MFSHSENDKNQNSNNNQYQANTVDKRIQRIHFNDEMDAKYGFLRYKGAVEKIGWLINMQPAEYLDDSKAFISAVDYYFLAEDNSKFKVTVPYNPYFYIQCRKNTERDVLAYLSRKYVGRITRIEIVEKEDLDLPNHLIGLKQTYLKLYYLNVDELVKVRRDLMSVIKRNKETSDKNSYDSVTIRDDNFANKRTDQLENIIDIREYDVPYHIRVSIDLKINVGLWYSVRCPGQDSPNITPKPEMVDRLDPVVLAYDIETTKLPLKFPDSATDQIMMISYMIDGNGYLITNREIISEDVEDFDFSPKPEFPGHFIIFNEADEKALLRRFFEHIIEVQPQIIVTYNGDGFDWPFVDARASFHGMSMFKEIGYFKDSQDEYQCRCSIHMDCLKWVKRDSYLPIGSQGLKAVAKAKLNYNPIEIDPEDMCRFAVEQPQVLSNYSVSDAVATYYLYMKYVHPFIFALCTIIPMEPDSVLRKGSGTLCETLLMVQAYNANIIYPNKQDTILNKMTADGHVLDTETYVGASVEALESGVFRSDIPCKFKLNPEQIQMLIDNVKRTMQRAIEVEEKVALSLTVNFDEVCNEIIEKLSMLRDCPNRLENPLIYHLDVGAMYPNIILTNRLQPSAIVNDSDCASCDFYKSDAKCQRSMKWINRIEYMPATKSEFQRIQQQLENEKFPPLKKGDKMRSFHQLSLEEQAEVEKKRLQEYCRKAYKRVHITREDLRETVVCQRENSFYVDTVRAFRDRRYEFKNLHKVWKKKMAAAQEKKDHLETKHCSAMVILYESLQLAHKCILNSFYGYVMRKGARWYSMEMAGIVCYTGSTIIKRARELIEAIGRPLELDTDGIWCILPATFPENFVITTTDPKKKLVISYPCAMLNLLIKDFYTNDQYHELVDKKMLKYDIRSENSVFFEVDGPYHAMVLPASKEEGKRLKKRYAVFNFDGTLAELKGFEVKRNGELQLIKIFQSSVFEAFLKGDTLEECYEAVAKIANYWLDILYSKAETMPDNELFDLIAERRTMSKALEEYGDQKSTSISTARRLAEFLGDEMVKDKGLNCKYVISKKPEGTTVTERAIPIAIFQAEPSVCKHYLKKWLRAQNQGELEVRNFLDWEYYLERLNGCIQKIITIPAALQGVSNPVPRTVHPDWLHKRLAERNSTLRQRKIDELFSLAPHISMSNTQITDIEDFGTNKSQGGFSRPVVVTTVTEANRNSKRKHNNSIPERKVLVNWREILGAPPLSLGKTHKQMLEWLDFHKRKWLIQIEARKLRKQGITNDTETPLTSKQLATSRNLTSFIQKSVNNRFQRPWEIIAITETSQHGIFKMWTLVDTDIYPVNLEVPRIFYVNQIKPLEKESALCRRSTKHLPRSQPSFNLYEYSIPENIFQKHQNEIMSEFSNPNVEGIYEMNVPLVFRALIRLGCQCGLKKEVKKNDMDTYKLDDLEMKNEQMYFGNSSALKVLYIFAHYSASKIMIGFFIPSTSTAQLFVLDSVRVSNMPNINTLLSAEHEKRVKIGITDDLLPNATHKFEVKIETDINKLYKGLDRALAAYKDEKRGATYIALQSNIDETEFKENVPTIEEFPIVRINVKEKTGLFNVLDWQKVAAKHMISHYMNLNTILHNMLEQSRYLQVPIGNIPTDSTLFACDLFYARHLCKNNNLLWCSETAMPDLGGKQYDDYRLVQNYSETNSACLIQVNNPGFYHSICLDMDINSLSISALLQLNKINEYDGASSVNFTSAAQANLQQMLTGDMSSNIFSSYYDEATLAVPALRIMRTMVQFWLRDVATYGNAFADIQIIHFYRWLQSPNSLLYDPALRRTLQSYMKKLCILLINELKRLGANIIYADLSRIIVCTKKLLVEDSLTYMQYLTNNLQSKDIFGTIHIELNKLWKVLLWNDSANFGGIKVNIAEDVDFDESKEEVEMNWKISEFLPTSVQKNFTAIIAGYMGSIYEALKAERENTPTQNILAKLNTDKSHLNAGEDVTASAKVILYSQELVNGELTEQLLRLTQKLFKKLTDEDFPSLFGCRLKLRCPSLEFVKYICRILSLDKNIYNQVTKLRRDLLLLVNVREFSDEAQFADPSLSFVVPQLICIKCHQCRDVDLCRDPCSNLSEEDQDKQIGWFCSHCSCFYDIKQIEYYLIECLQAKMMVHVTQDLACEKCNEVRGGFLQKYCECTGNYRNTIHREEMSILVKTFMNFLKHVKMERLQKEVEWLVRYTPWLREKQ